MKNYDDEELEKLLKLFVNNLKLEEDKSYSKKLCIYFHEYACYKAILNISDPIEDGIEEDLAKRKRKLQNMYSKLSDEDKLLAAIESAVPDGIG